MADEFGKELEPLTFGFKNCIDPPISGVPSYRYDWVPKHYKDDTEDYDSDLPDLQPIS